MNNKKILLIYDKDDEIFKNVIFKAFDKPNLSELLISSIEINNGIRDLYDDVFDKSFYERILAAVSEASVVIIVVSSGVIANLELNYAMEHKSEDFKKKYLLNLIYRPCDTDECKWIEYGRIEPSLNYPLKTQTQNTKDKLISDTIADVSNWLKIGNKEIQKIFISYSSSDSFFVDTIKLKLEERSFKVYIDIDIPGGKKWRPEIDNMIKDSSFILLVLSKASKESEYVIYEWAYAMSREKIIIPVVIDDLDVKNLHPKLSPLQVIYFNHRKTRNIDNLISTIKKTYYQHV